MTTQNEKSLIAGSVVLAVARGDRLGTAKQVEIATRTMDALELIEAVASISISSAQALYGDDWHDQMLNALRDIAIEVRRGRSEMTENNESSRSSDSSAPGSEKGNESSRRRAALDRLRKQG